MKNRGIAGLSAVFLIVSLVVALGVLIFVTIRQTPSIEESTPSVQVISENIPTATPLLTKTSTTIPSTEPTPTEILLGTRLPPLSNIYFPTEEIDYPKDWPSELVYPQEFKLVEADSGKYPDSENTGYVAKLRFEGNIEKAEELLTSFFTERGWNIQERIEHSYGGSMIIIGKETDEESGIIFIGVDTNGQNHSTIFATVFP